jgi:hypothetical protein
MQLSANASHHCGCSHSASTDSRSKVFHLQVRPPPVTCLVRVSLLLFLLLLCCCCCCCACEHRADVRCRCLLRLLAEQHRTDGSSRASISRVVTASSTVNEKWLLPLLLAQPLCDPADQQAAHTPRNTHRPHTLAQTSLHTHSINTHQTTRATSHTHQLAAPHTNSSTATARTKPGTRHRSPYMVHSIIGTRRQLEPADTRPRPRDPTPPP